jgi:hypothetical protein
MFDRAKTTMAILLAVLFLLTLTAGAVSAKDIKAHEMFATKKIDWPQLPEINDNNNMVVYNLGTTPGVIASPAHLLAPEVTFSASQSTIPIKGFSTVEAIMRTEQPRGEIR